MSTTKLRPNSFENFFATPFHYGEGYGYAVNARNENEAVDKLAADFDDWHWIVGDSKKYLKADLRSNLKDGYVKWHGYIDDDGEMHNGWVIHATLPMNTRGYRHVYYSDYEKHYVLHGHHFEPKVNEGGRREWGRDCNVCGERP